MAGFAAPPRAGSPARLRLSLVATAVAVGLVVLFATPPAGAKARRLRIDPEALSGRIAQYLLGESELSTRTSSSPQVSFGTNVRLSDEHFRKRIISQTEPSVAASPDGQTLVAGFHDLWPKTQDFVCRFAFSNNGGDDWQLGGATPLQAEGNFCSDPAIASDSDGNFYYAYLDINFGAIRSDVDVAKSTDGGHTFSTFSVATDGAPRTNFPDKEFIAVDSTGGAFGGNVYVSWTDFLNPQDPHGLDNGQIKVVRSTDGGATWSEPIAISESAQFPQAISGSNPVVAPDGTVYIFYADFTSNTGPLAIKYSKSDDGGATWTSPVDVASDRASPGRFRLRNADPNFGTVAGAGFRSNSFPSGAIAPDGSIYVVWTEFPSLDACTPDGSGRPPCEDADVVLAKSTDGGGTWSAPVKFSDENPAGETDQFFPWVAVHPNGLVSIVWQDKRNDPDNIDYDVFYTSTTDGVTFTANQQINTLPSLVGLTTFIGDYNQIAATPSAVIPVWTDRRFGNNDIFTVKGSL
jgi:hypothetical protein